MSKLRQDLDRRRDADGAVPSALPAGNQKCALVVATWEGQIWVLPWVHLAAARLDATRMELSFGYCAVMVTGRNLHSLVDDLAGFRIGVLRARPADFRGNAADDETFISRIEVAVEGETPSPPSPGLASRPKS